MRLHGYCTRCRKIRRVRITGAPAPRGVVQTGICAECEEGGKTAPNIGPNCANGNHESCRWAGSPNNPAAVCDCPCHETTRDCPACGRRRSCDWVDDAWVCRRPTCGAEFAPEAWDAP